MEVEAGGLLGEAVEEMVLAGSSDDEEAAQLFAAVEGDSREDFCVLRGEAVEDEAREGRSVFGAGVECGKVVAEELGVDALRHVSGE